MIEKNGMFNLDIKDLLNLLPHRYPFLLIDKVKDIVPNQSGIGIKCVTINEEFFNGHFPGNPVMPGVLMIEAMAQTCIMMILPFIKERREDFLFMFCSIDKVKFKRPVVPGDVLEIKMNKIAAKGPLTKCYGVITVEGQVCAEAEVSAFMVDTAKSKK